MEHIRIAHYKLHSSTAHEVAERADSVGGLLDILKSCSGFVSYALADIGGGEIITIGRWASREDADAAAAESADWARDNIGETVSTNHVYAGDVLVMLHGLASRDERAGSSGTGEPSSIPIGGDGYQTEPPTPRD